MPVEALRCLASQVGCKIGRLLCLACHLRDTRIETQTTSRNKQKISSLIPIEAVRFWACEAWRIDGYLKLLSLARDSYRIDARNRNIRVSKDLWAEMNS